MKKIITLIDLYKFEPSLAVSLLWQYLPSETVARFSANFPSEFLADACAYESVIFDEDNREKVKSVERGWTIGIYPRGESNNAITQEWRKFVSEISGIDQK